MRKELRALQSFIDHEEKLAELILSVHEYECEIKDYLAKSDYDPDEFRDFIMDLLYEGETHKSSSTLGTYLINMALDYCITWAWLSNIIYERVR